MRLIFLGPPGSGKGTQTVRIAKEFNLELISTGNMLREEVDRHRRLGNYVRPYLESGLLVPDNIMIEVVRGRIPTFTESESVPDRNHGFILDGFPRTIEQAKELERITDVDKVIYFRLSPEIIVHRLSNRRICPRCARVYNLITTPPKKNGLCDVCRIALKVRKDDNRSVIRKRIEIYKNETESLLNFYKKKSILTQIDASGGVDEVYSKLKEILSGQ